jgi:hypothetical protein
VPILRAITERGAEWDDPSEGLLFELLLDVERDEEQFVIVERTADRTGQTYAQVIKDGAGGWVIERRDGSPETHRAANVPGIRDAHDLLTCWAFDLPMPRSVTWTPLQT